LVEAIAIIEFNYLRRGGFPNIQDNSNYRKIPRDALRVGILCMTSRINEMLVKKNEDKDEYIKILLTIHSALKLLEK
jgi:hypothetical protein